MYAIIFSLVKSRANFSIKKIILELYVLYLGKSISICHDKRIPNIFAYSETRSRDLTVPSICKERVFTVAKPELKVAVIISSGIFSFIY
jgi:hypothetical protein